MSPSSDRKDATRASLGGVAGATPVRRGRTCLRAAQDDVAACELARDLADGGVDVVDLAVLESSVPGLLGLGGWCLGRVLEAAEVQK
jgi:hypothetical protein